MSNASFQLKGGCCKNTCFASACHKALRFSFLSTLVLVILTPGLVIAQFRFSDDFEDTLSEWELVDEHAIAIIESSDGIHNRVMQMQPDGIVYTLIKDSDQWGPVRIEGEVLVPTKRHSYLGLIYNYTRNDSQTDFGEIYLKGNKSSLRVNPWRDGNVSRLLYEEYKTPIRNNNNILIVR